MVTVLTRTIGPSGRDYASFTLAEADVTNIGTSADLVANDEAIVFEADAGTYAGAVTFSSTLVTDATRNVTYRPATGSEHSGARGAGPFIQASSGSAILVQDDFTIFAGLSAEANATYCLDVRAEGVKIDSLVLESLAATTAIIRPGSSAAVTIVQNTSVYHTSGHAGLYAFDVGDILFANNTVLSVGTTTGQDFRLRELTASTLSILLVNNLSLGPLGVLVEGTPALTGSNNFGPSTSPFPAALQGSPYPITATTDTSPGAGDWAIYQASNGQLYNIVANDVWQQGVGPTANSDVPATDILGYARYGATANPGAFELGLPVPGIRVKPRHFQVNTAATAHAVSVWQPQLRKL